MTREERIRWTQAREAYEEPIIRRARARGKVPVIDCCDPRYPVPAAVLAELARLEDPWFREATYRESSSLRRKAASHRSLANHLAEQGKAEQAAQLRTRAEALDAQALAIVEVIRP